MHALTCRQVFNLVTQQDSATGTTIAREAKADGSSMRVIATLTMVFLPGTFMSSVFGMAVLDHARWWLYVALTLPLTLLVIGIWLVWQNFNNLARLQWRFWRTKKPLQKHSAA
jgi:cytochrome c biogenesis protein CcdA